MGQEDKFHRMLVYGEPGAGKTVFAGTSPKALIITNDGAETMSAAAMGSTADVWVAPTYEDIDEAFEYLRHEGHKTYDWVWIDNMTLLQDQAMDQIMEELVRAKPNRNRWVPDQHEYLVNQNRLSTMVRSFKKLPMNVGFTAHVMKTEDMDGRVLYLPMIQGGQGALSQKICGYMNIVGYIAVVKKDGKNQRTMFMEKQGKYHAKGRFPGMESRLVDPTVPLLEKAIAATVPNAAAAPKRRRSTSTTRRKATTS
jgi:phage nucleotide-binding protein